MLVDPADLVVILPAQNRYEQRGGGTSTSTERRIRFSPEIKGHPQVGESKPEWEILHWLQHLPSQIKRVSMFPYVSIYS